MATKLVTILFGCYRRGEADDPETYFAAVVAVLTGYPTLIAQAVCDPRGGIPSKSQFLPTIYEIWSACEARIRPLIDAEARQRRMVEDEANRPAEISEAAAERRKAFIAEWRLKSAAELSADESGEIKLHEMDVRKCRGEMRDLVAKALNARLAELSADSAATPLRLSDATLATVAGRAPAPRAAVEAGFVA